MDFNLFSNLEYCGAIVDSLRGQLLYTHIPPAIISLILCGYLLYQKRTLATWLLAAISVVFSGWIIANLTIWLAYDQNTLLMFLWSLIGLFSSLIFILIFYFIFVFVAGRDMPSWLVYLWTGTLLPLIFLTPSSWNLESFYIRDCIALEGVWFTNYYYALGLLVAICLPLIFIFRRQTSSALGLPSISASVLAVVGAELFVVTFLTTGFLASYLVESGLVPDFGIEQYGIVTMAIFMSFLAYIIVQYRAFNLKLLAAQVLVIGLVLLIAAEYLFVENTAGYALVTLTLTITIFFGYLLVRGVKREIEQRERITRLAKDLEAANVRLKGLDKLKTEFVSIASHQLRSPISAIKGYASMLLEGSFGQLSIGTREAIGRIFSSSALMARSVEDFLNVSRIELGRMKYDLSQFDICKLIETVVDEQKPLAEEKKLTLKFFKDKSVTACDMFADLGKVKQVLTNFIDNAIKYTPRGSITITLARDLRRNIVRVGVTDTGVGMTQETIRKLFAKFARADNANKVNVIGTGLGLYVAKQLIEAHGGRVWAESPGEGKGSSFFFELPLQAKGEAVASGVAVPIPVGASK